MQDSENGKAQPIEEPATLETVAGPEESEASSRMLFEHCPVGMMLVDAESGRHVDCNRRAAELLGLSREEFLSVAQDAISPVHQPDGSVSADKAKQIITRAAQGEPTTFEWTCRHSSGEERAVEVSLAKLPTDGRNLLLGTIVDITERKRARDALRLSEERYRSIATTSLQGIWCYKIDPPLPTGLPIEQQIDWTFDHAVVEECNDVYASAFGFSSSAELIGRRYVEVSGGDEETAREVIRAWIEGGYAFNGVELPAVTQSGEIGWGLVSGVSLLEQGRVVRTWGKQLDVTERKRAEEALRDNEERFRTLVADIPGAVYRCKNDRDWTMQFISDAIQRITGYPASDFVGGGVRTLASVIHPDDREEVWQVVQRAVGDNEPFSLEYRILHANGGIRWVLERGRGVLSEDGAIEYLDGVILDITERKRAERALQESEANNRAILNALPDMMFRLTRDGLHKDFYASSRNQLFVPPEDIVGRGLGELLPADTADKYLHHIAQCIDNDSMEVFEYRLRFSEVDQRDYEARMVPHEAGDVLAIVRDVTKRKQAEVALRASEEQYRSLFEAANDAIFVMDGELFVDCNPQTLQLFGCTAEQILNKPPDRFSPPRQPDGRDSREKALGLLAEAYGGRPLFFEWRHYRYDGTPFDAEVSLNRFELGGRFLVFAIVRDITERKRTEVELLRSEARYRAIVQDQTELICRNLPDGTLTFVNEAYCRYFGKDYDELVGHRFIPLVHPEDESVVHEHFASLSRANPVATYEHRVITADGEARWHQWTNRAILDEDGQLVEFQGAGRDVTERKRTEETFRSVVAGTSGAVGEAFFQNLVQNLASALGVRYAMVAETAGPGPDSAATLAVWAGHGPADNFRYDLAGTPCANVTIEGTCTYPNNVQRGFPEDQLLIDMGVEGYMGTPLRDSAGNVIGLLAVLDDRPMEEAPLTESLLEIFSIRAAAELERMRAEEALRESEEAIRAVVETSQDWIWSIDVNGVHTYCNPAVEDILGYRPEELVGHNSLDLIQTEDREYVQRNLPKWIAQRRGWRDLVIRWQHKDGGWRYLESNAVAIFDTQGELLGFRGVDRDVTERRQTDERLRQMQSQLAHVARLSAMGEMVAGIAHEVNQPLYAIRNFAEAGANLLAASDGTNLDELREWNAGIGRAATHAAETVKRLRAFARRTESKRSFCPLEEILDESIQLVAFEARRRSIAVRREQPEVSPTVYVDRVETQQVLVNLLQNACEAAEEGLQEKPEIAIRTEIAGDFVNVSIADNGRGLPSGEDLRIFDAFVSTKPNGLGIGLAIANTIVEAHGGELRATANRDAGATFHFTLPVIEEGQADGR